MCVRCLPGMDEFEQAPCEPRSQGAWPPRRLSDANPQRSCESIDGRRRAFPLEPASGGGEGRPSARRHRSLFDGIGPQSPAKLSRRSACEAQGHRSTRLPDLIWRVSWRIAEQAKARDRPQIGTALAPVECLERPELAAVRPRERPTFRRYSRGLALDCV
jgi:hypothetical protein